MCVTDLERVRSVLDKLIAVEREFEKLTAPFDPNAPQQASVPVYQVTAEEYEDVLRARKKSLEVQLHELGYVAPERRDG